MKPGILQKGTKLTKIIEKLSPGRPGFLGALCSSRPKDSCGARFLSLALVIPILNRSNAQRGDVAMAIFAGYATGQFMPVF
jgi:hypothetical protein